MCTSNTYKICCQYDYIENLKSNKIVLKKMSICLSTFYNLQAHVFILLLNSSVTTHCVFSRGLIMGIWNSHTSVGNILGGLIAGAESNSLDTWFVTFNIAISQLNNS